MKEDMDVVDLNQQPQRGQLKKHDDDAMQISLRDLTLDDGGPHRFEALQQNGAPVRETSPFGIPWFRPAKREPRVLVYTHNNNDTAIKKPIIMQNVLVPEDLSVGYVAVPHKRPIPTIMGHVEICLVLNRHYETNNNSNNNNSLRSKFDDDDEDSSENDSEHDNDDDDEDEDVIFELPKHPQRVAIKVNYQSKIQELRNKKRHAEDPIQEIAAMEYIGSTFDNNNSNYYYNNNKNTTSNNNNKNNNTAARPLHNNNNNHVPESYDKNKPPVPLFSSASTTTTCSPSSPQVLLHKAYNHVLTLKDVLNDGSNLYVVLPYCTHGDLFDLIHTHVGVGLEETLARSYFFQICRGVAHLHQHGIVHRDLSPENIMLTTTPMQQQQANNNNNNNDDDVPICRVIDFGMSLRLPHLNHVLTGPLGTCGKLPYMAPEIYLNQRPFDGALVDAWSCGTILWCLLTGNRSYERAHVSDAQFYWMTHDMMRLLTDWGLSNQISPHAIDVMTKLLQIDPMKRWTIQQLMSSHVWFEPERRALYETYRRETTTFSK